ncbi:MAG: FAD-binding and (Fe-S)-binding domain-containing protein [Saprospiraceae bacterium]|jgi:FAD/FMN-containing dehydrogenase/Fe-S oxidoreductase
MEVFLHGLAMKLHGEFRYDRLSRALYATDGSIYKQWPMAVAFPKNEDDLKEIILFANTHKTPLIMRTAGTSLAGQCVGQGIVVDTSRYLNKILELNPEERSVWVQPGVIRDELNAFLKPYGLFFGPNTSTANRAMIGGMVGNNSCGTTSIVYGNTRDHVLELRCLLSDGSPVAFGPLNDAEIAQKLEGDQLENQLYRQIFGALKDSGQRAEIEREFPKPEIHRRNTGYAVDMLLRQRPFTPGGPPFNLATMLCGSEGTLAVTTAIKLSLDPLPDPHDVVVCPHFNSVNESMRAVLIAMQHRPDACELMDKIILDCTRDNIEQQKNRFFLEGDPQAVLMIEFRGKTPEEAEKKADALIADLQKAGMGYAFPKIPAPRSKSVWALRAAGFGVLSNIKSEAKPLEFIEDTAVDLPDLPDYIDEFGRIMEGYGQQVIYYAHAGAGELHLRPSINLKTSEGVRQLRNIAEVSARLVKKYRGSLSGEHGDGRVRGEFIPIVLGEKNYQLLRQIKYTWDPQGLLNPGKIVDALPMDEDLRYPQDQPAPKFATVFDFSETGGILKMAEKCSGSGDCRKLAFSGGTMCPSYMVTRNEKDSTRGRANALREFLTMNVKSNPFNHPEIYEAMDLCLSCKGCKSECPSNVDMATLKAEFLHQYHQSNGIPFRSRVFGNIGKINALAAKVPRISNFFLKQPATSFLIKKALGIAPQRSLPPVSRSLRKWFEGSVGKNTPKAPKGKVFFFCDEFTNYNDVPIGRKAIELLWALGYAVEMPRHPESGRAYFSKGMLDEARQLAQENVKIFLPLVSAESPLIGLEPSAILGFVDEYPRLVGEKDREAAKNLGRNALLLEAFLVREAQAGRIGPEYFTQEKKQVFVHGHCHQKALSGAGFTAQALSLPANYEISLLETGCCGMAGSFGYEEEHYVLSMQVGELALFPQVRKMPEGAVLVAPGTSCRHQVLDGTGRKALHPAEVLWEALKKNAYNLQVSA